MPGPRAGLYLVCQIVCWCVSVDAFLVNYAVRQVASRPPDPRRWAVYVYVGEC